jgi:hypothetical protein
LKLSIWIPNTQLQVADQLQHDSEQTQVVADYENISVYYNQWKWSQLDHPIQVPSLAPASAPLAVYPPTQLPAFSFKSDSSISSTVVCSPTAQPLLPPMAILNPNTQLAAWDQPQQTQVPVAADYKITQGSAIDTATRPTIIRPVELVVVQGVPGSPMDSPLREKKHACTMCHKRQVHFCFVLFFLPLCSS